MATATPPTDGTYTIYVTSLADNTGSHELILYRQDANGQLPGTAGRVSAGSLLHPHRLAGNRASRNRTSSLNVPEIRAPQAARRVGMGVEKNFCNFYTVGTGRRAARLHTHSGNVW